MDNKVSTGNRTDLKWLQNQPIDTQLAMIQHHLSLTQMLVNELLENEVVRLAGERYSRDKPHDGRYSRYGFNPSSVRVGEQRIKVEVPRIWDNEEEKNRTLETFLAMQEQEVDEERLYNGLLKGLSTRDYEGVVDGAGESFGISKSSLSRSFVEQTAAKLAEFETRDLTHYRFVALFIDGKHQAGQQIIIVLGLTEKGEKIPLGFVQADGESALAINDLWKNLLHRNLQIGDGALFIIDGSKGLRKSILDSFGKKALIQRCIWHKRENIEGYLKESLHAEFRSRYHGALAQTTFELAHEKMLELKNWLQKINLSAANSLDEALEDLLTLHRLGVYQELGKSLSTTNCIENLNSQLGKYTRKIKHWKNSEQRHRWVAAALLLIETRMHKIQNHQKLHMLQSAISKFLLNHLEPA